MIHRLFCVFVLMSCVVPSFLYAEVLGSIILKDGSIIHGNIVEMSEGTLTVKAAYGAGDPFLIKWGEVVNIATSQPVTFILDDGSSLIGAAEKADLGEVRIKTGTLTLPIPVALASVKAINPTKKPPVKFEANFNFGSKISSGNTDDAQVNLLGGFIARSERLRLILDARYFYAEESNSVTDRNAFGTMDFNFFMIKRLYAFLAVLMQQDTFDDLELRTAVTAGPGYQFIEKGDYANPYLSMMSLQADVGAGFVNEDRKIGEDDNHGVLRESLRWEWEVIPKLSIFHRHQIYPEMSDFNNYIINSLQGIRFNVYKGLSVSGQVQWNYDNKPADDSKKGDTTIFLTLGYNYEN
jgi:putative salt-induced outer membrane protein YdiY